MHYLGGVWTDILGWAVIPVGLTIFAGLLLLLLEGRRSLRGDGAGGTTPRLDRAREWELVMRSAARELPRGPKVEKLQADAMVKVESAEYAYNRLVLDCAKLCNVPAAPTVELVGALPCATEEPAQERAPLAA